MRTQVTAGELADRLADSGIRLVGGDPTAPVRGVGCTVHDPVAPTTGPASGVVLGVGVRIDDLGTLRALADSGYDAVVLRTEPGARLDDAPLPVLGAPPEAAWLHLDSLIGTVLQRLEPRDGSEDLFEMANSVAAMVGGAIAIEDPARKVLAYSTLAGQVIDEDRRAAIIGRQVPDLPENDRQYASVYAAHGPVHIRGERPGDLDRVAVAVRAGGQLLGSLWAIDVGLPAPGAPDSAAPDDPAAEGSPDRRVSAMGEDELMILGRAAEIIALHLLRVRTAAEVMHRQRADLTLRALGGGPDAELSVRRLGLDQGGPFTVVALTSTTWTTDLEQIAWQRFLGVVSAYLSGWQSRSGLATAGTTVYVLLSGPIVTEIDRVASNVDVIVERGLRLGLHLRGGVGGAVERPDALDRSRDDADLLVLLPRREGEGPLITADACRSRLSLFTLARLATDEPRLLSPTALSMLEHDARRDTEFATTIRIWCEQGMDVAATARSLTVHVNTVRYRLARARTLFGIGDDPDDLLSLWLTLRLTASGQIADQPGWSGMLPASQ
ncbi:CdaR family transcriptional regulator [Nocardioides sp. R-C-SC26]|uniref:PucR family transcriptional regulator n=1 Tax=Nocardioides sp. R-C-SC26 TaxID=2870414 RepID=UPI001E29B854|nr:helix-turn-helix domain-containing protein [Nocardioides sp. R-C-SC26]